jgi:hypothetical protein
MPQHTPSITIGRKEGKGKEGRRKEKRKNFLKSIECNQWEKNYYTSLAFLM